MNVEVLALIEISRDQISSSVFQSKQLALDINSCVYYANLWDYKRNETRKWNAKKKIRSKLPQLPHTRALLLHHFFFDFVFEVNSLSLPTRSWMRNLKIYSDDWRWWHGAERESAKTKLHKNLFAFSTVFAGCGPISLDYFLFMLFFPNHHHHPSSRLKSAISFV